MSAADPLLDMLRPQQLTAVVDIGANPSSVGAPSYQPMLDMRLCTVTGFEPQAEAHAALTARNSASETYTALCDRQWWRQQHSTSAPRGACRAC